MNCNYSIASNVSFSLKSNIEHLIELLFTDDQDHKAYAHIEIYVRSGDTRGYVQFTDAVGHEKLGYGNTSRS